MSKVMLIAAGAGTTSGFASLAFLSGLPGSMLVVYLASLPLLLVGIDHGIKAVTISCTIGIVISVLAGNALLGGLFTIIHASPAWLIVRVALMKRSEPGIEREQWHPAGTILCILSVFSAGILTLALVLSQEEIDGFQGLIRSYLNQAFNNMLPVDENVRSDLVRLIVPLFPGYVGISWILMVVFNASIALAILKRAKRTDRPKIKLSNLTLPDWISWFLVVSASIYLFSYDELEFFSRNLTLILTVPFFFLGLAVLHNLASHVTFPRLLLTAVYMALMLSGWIALIITLTGILEQWFGLRRYFTNHG